MTLWLSILKFLLRWKCHSSIFIDTSWDFFFFLSNNNISCWRLRDNKCVEWNAGYNIYRCRWPIWIWKPSGCLKIRPSRCSRSRQISTTRPANRSSPVSYYPNWNIPTSRKVRYPSVFFIAKLLRFCCHYASLASFLFLFFFLLLKTASSSSVFQMPPTQRAGFWFSDAFIEYQVLKKKISIGIRCSLDK